MRKNNQYMSGTGGGPSKCNPLTPTEEKVSELLNLKTAVSGLPRTKSFGVNLLNSYNIWIHQKQQHLQ